MIIRRHSGWTEEKAEHGEEVKEKCTDMEYHNLEIRHKTKIQCMRTREWIRRAETT